MNSPYITDPATIYNIFKSEQQAEDAIEVTWDTEILTHDPEPYRCVRAGAGRYRVMRGDIRESRDFATMTEARKAQADLEAS